MCTERQSSSTDLYPCQFITVLKQKLTTLPRLALSFEASCLNLFSSVEDSVIRNGQWYELKEPWFIKCLKDLLFPTFLIPVMPIFLTSRLPGKTVSFPNQRNNSSRFWGTFFYPIRKLNVGCFSDCGEYNEPDFLTSELPIKDDWLQGSSTWVLGILHCPELKKKSFLNQTEVHAKDLHYNNSF